MTLGRGPRHGAARRDRLVVGMGVEEDECVRHGDATCHRGGRGRVRRHDAPSCSARGVPGWARNLTLESANRRVAGPPGGAACKFGERSAGRGRLCAAAGGDGLRQRVVRVEGGGSGGGGGSSDQTNTTVNQPGVSADTIKVGGVASITNPLNAPYGDIFKGVQAYFAMVNKAGGIYGRKLEVTSERDDQVTQNLREVQGLLNEDDVFAAVGMATIFDFSGGSQALEANGIPTFGWNINADWNKPNLFGNSGALCIGCEGIELPWMAKELGRDDRRPRLQRRQLQGLRQGRAEVLQQVSVGEDRLLLRQPLVRRRRLQRRGVQDEGRRRRLHHHLYGHQRRARSGEGGAQAGAQRDPVPAERLRPGVHEGQRPVLRGLVRPGALRALRDQPRPKSLDEYLTWMDKQGDTPNEYTTYGWINAAMLVEGLKAADRTSPRRRSSPSSTR